MQLSLNPRIETFQLETIRTAIAAQIAPTTHAYIHGESERLARPILLMAGRFPEAAWTAWIAKVAAWPGDPADAFKSEASLARRHNLQAFLQALYINAALNSDPKDDVLLPGVKAALLALP
jgi:hypothetical protein